MRRAVFLDRDGVLSKLVWRNGRGVSPRTIEEFELLPNVSAATETLRKSGLLIVVVTNQPDIARGLMKSNDLRLMHERLQEAIAPDAIYSCPHDDRDDCICRKPKPGLLLQAAEELSIDLSSSYFVGDSWKDITAGREVGCKTFLLTGSGDDSVAVAADYVVPHLQEAVELMTRALASDGEN